MNSQLSDFLNKYITDDKINYTHCNSISYGIDNDIYYIIPDNKMMEFYYYYNIALLENNDLYLGQNSKNFGPVIIDIDLKYESNIYSSNNRIYDSILEKIVEIYIKLLNKYLKIDKSKLQCFVLEKKEPFWKEEKKYFSDGLHIIFPFICIPTYFQKYIRIKFIKEAKKNNLFDNLPLLQNIYSIVDEKIIEDINWRMYGSKKFGTTYPYLLTKIYDYKLNQLDINKYNSFDLIYILSIQKYKKNNINNLNEHFNSNENNIFIKFVIFSYILILIFFIYNK